MKELVAAIGPIDPDCSNRANLPKIVMKMGGHEFPVGPDVYVLQGTRNGMPHCRLGVHPQHSMSFWIFGAAYLRAYYTVYDRGLNRVGFAPALAPK
jgi:hypothetical protein